MSILPSRNLGSTSSSSSSNLQSPNPNSEHGAFFPQQQQQLFQFSDSLSDQTHTLQSFQISNPTATSSDLSGSMAPTAEDSGGSSKKVNEARKQYGKKSFAHHKTGTDYQRQAAGRAGIVSAQHRGKSESIVFPGSQQTTGPTHQSGRKGQMINGNHLLNFHYDPISRSQPKTPPPRRQQKRKSYNKDLFLQANYKFVLLDSGNYEPETMDPDKALHWEDIICVKYSTPLAVQCPICLEDPLCPQITSCGHIFCFPCILRYFSVGEEKVECSKKCPLCFMMISSKDLYTIYIENVKLYCVGDTVEFMLLTRQKDSFTLSLKNKQGMESVEEVHDSFSKFTFTSDVDLSVRKAMSELDSWLARADSGLVDDLERLPYVCAAMEHLEQRKTNWNEHRVGNGSDTFRYSDYHTRSPSAASVTNIDHESGQFIWGTLFANVDDKPTRLESSNQDTKHGDPCMIQVSDVVESYDNRDGALSSSYDDNNSMHRQTNGYKDIKDNNSYNFYQAVDGQHLILHPLNIKCLLHHYGSYSRLPHRICGKIVQLETVTQSEAMRRRYRHLSHFSLTTTFQLCEIDLSDHLPPDALSPFMDEIKNRAKQRKRLARKEQEEKIKAEVAAATEYVSMSFNFAQSHDFSPTFSMDDFEALGSSAVVSASPLSVGDRPLFSNVTRMGFAAAHDSPAWKIEEAHILPKTDVASNSSSVSGSPSFANVISRAKPVESKPTEICKKGKKPNRVLLSTAGGRRY